MDRAQYEKIKSKWWEFMIFKKADMAASMFSYNDTMMMHVFIVHQHEESAAQS